MKANRILIALFLALSFTSCKKEETKKAEEAKPSEVVTFTLNAIVKQKDDFQIFYKEDNDPQTPFDEVKSVWSSASGSETPQNIVFTLPEGVFPTQIRFDLGQNKDQSEIVINDFKVTYHDKSFEAKGPDFFNFFTPDENFVKIDKLTSKVIPVKGTSYDPMVFSNADYNAQLAKLIQ